MLKYLKYEMKNSIKFISMLLVAVLVSTLLLQNFAINTFGGFSEGGFSETFAVIPVLIIMGAGLVYFVFTVNLMKKDLYEDKGYLTFSLPIKGYKIILAKILCSFVYLAITTIIVLFFNFILARYVTFPNGMKQFIFSMNEFIKGLKNDGQFGVFLIEMLKWLFLSIILTITNLAILYFSLALGKVFIQKKKFSSLWFLIYIINNYIFARVYEPVINNEISRLDYFDSYNVTVSSLGLLSIGVAILISLVLVIASGILLDKKVEI